MLEFLYEMKLSSVWLADINWGVKNKFAPTKPLGTKTSTKDHRIVMHTETAELGLK